MKENHGEKQFWLFDLRYDKIQYADPRIPKILLFWYCATVLYTLIYVFIWQKDAIYMPSSGLMSASGYVCLVFFLGLEALLFVLELQASRKTSEVKPFEGDSGLYSFKDNKHPDDFRIEHSDPKDLHSLRQPQANNAGYNIPHSNPSYLNIQQPKGTQEQIKERKATGNQSIADFAHINDIAAASAANNQNLPGKDKKYPNSQIFPSLSNIGRLQNQQQNQQLFAMGHSQHKKSSFRIFLKIFGLSSGLLIMIFGHITLFFLNFMHIPEYGTHWIVVGINLLQMVTGNLFASIAGLNIIYNMARDKTFLNSCIFSEELPPLILSLIHSTAYYNFVLLLIAIIWGSIYTVSFTADIPSILCLVFLGLIIVFLLVREYRNSLLHLDL